MDKGVIRAAARIFMDIHGEPPRCPHGSFLADWNGEPTMPPCGCNTFVEWLEKRMSATRPTPRAADQPKAGG